jgi:hypothetical protein
VRDKLDKDFEKLFPRLEDAGYNVTSRKAKKYNCVAWAAKRDEDQWWEPLKEPGCYWPKEVPFDHAFENYIKLFESLGYSQCNNASLENGFEKVAIFKDIYGWFMHVAHQLEDGQWTSKLGPDEDIKHNSAEALEGDRPLTAYGKVEVWMKRKRQIWEKQNQKPKLFSRLWEFFKLLLKKFLQTLSSSPTNS